jgi:hypothetical protein
MDLAEQFLQLRAAVEEGSVIRDHIRNDEATIVTPRKSLISLTSALGP